MLGAFRVLASDRYLEKGMGLMALTGHRPADRRAIWVEADLRILRIRLIWKSLKQVFDRWVSTANGL
jgi:hypothetical protein